MTKIKNLQKTKPDTFESVLASLKETGKRFREMKQLFKEDRKDTERLIKETRESQKETDRLIKENAEQMKDTDRRMKKLQKTLGEWADYHGAFAEDYFFNSSPKKFCFPSSNELKK